LDEKVDLTISALVGEDSYKYAYCAHRFLLSQHIDTPDAYSIIAALADKFKQVNKESVLLLQDGRFVMLNDTWFDIVEAILVPATDVPRQPIFVALLYLYHGCKEF